MLKKLDTILKKISNLLSRIVGYLLISLMGTMTAIVLTGVFYRYALQHPLSWPEEIARYLMVWGGFLAASLALKKGLHVGMVFLMEKMPLKIGRWVRIFAKFCILLFLLTVTKEGFTLVKFVSAQRSPALMIPMWLPYLAIPVGCSLMTIEMVYLIVGDLKG